MAGDIPELLTRFFKQKKEEGVTLYTQFEGMKLLTTMLLEEVYKK